MDEKSGSIIPKKMPVRIGDSNQFLRGLVILENRSPVHVRITVEEVGGEGKRSDVGLAMGPFNEFCDRLFSWRASTFYPKDPKGGSRTIDEDVINPYWWRYRQAFEIWGEGDDLDNLLKQLWQDYRDDLGIQPNHATKTRKTDRQNFMNAMKARLMQWKKNKNIS